MTKQDNIRANFNRPSVRGRQGRGGRGRGERKAPNDQKMTDFLTGKNNPGGKHNDDSLNDHSESSEEDEDYDASLIIRRDIRKRMLRDPGEEEKEERKATRQGSTPDRILAAKTRGSLSPHYETIDYDEDEDTQDKELTQATQMESANEEETPGTTIDSTRTQDSKTENADDRGSSDTEETKEENLEPDDQGRWEEQDEKVRLHGVHRRLYVKRYDLRLKVNPSTNPTAEIHTSLKMVLGELWKQDLSLMLIPYKEEDHQDDRAYIWSTNSKKLDGVTTLQGLQKYLHGIRPRTKGGDLYCQIALASNKSMVKIMEESGYWFQETGHGLWIRQVQAERVVTLGWLLYSHRKIDLTALQEILEQRTRAKLGLRFRAIQTGEPYGTISNQDLPRAIHIDTSTQNQRRVEQLLREMYSPTKVIFPGGMKFRFIPQLSSLASAKSIANFRMITLRQAQFCSKVLGAESWELQNIDVIDSQAKTTLRREVMRIKSISRPNLSVFLSVDKTFNDKSVTFSFIPEMEPEARMYIAALLPYLRHVSGKWVEKYFTPSAIERAEDMVWNEESREVWSPNDEAVQQVIHLDEEYQFNETSPQQGTTVVPPNQNPQGGPGQPPGQPTPSTRGNPGTQAFLRDTDSIGTFSSGQRSTPQSSQSQRRREDRSTSSSVSLESQVSSLRQDFLNLQTSINDSIANQVRTAITDSLREVLTAAPGRARNPNGENDTGEPLGNSGDNL